MAKEKSRLFVEEVLLLLREKNKHLSVLSWILNQKVLKSIKVCYGQTVDIGSGFKALKISKRSYITCWNPEIKGVIKDERDMQDNLPNRLDLYW